MGISINDGTPTWMVKFMMEKNTVDMDVLGVLFRESLIFLFLIASLKMD
jgi:hypothetical protein